MKLTDVEDANEGITDLIFPDIREAKADTNESIKDLICRGLSFMLP